MVLEETLAAYNATPHSSLGGRAPFEVVFGVKFSSDSQEFLTSSVMSEFWTVVRDDILAAQAKNMRYCGFDTRVTRFRVGDLVFIRNTSAMAQRKLKIDLPNTVSGKVIEIGRKSAVVEEVETQKQYRRPLNFLQPRFE